jgi:dolichyl-phosphate-mannose--protein O-mannosyl transferase
MPATAATAAAVAALLALSAAASDPDAAATEVVAYGSAIKLQHVATSHRLHSHEIPYGSGSRQQSVTAYPDGGDVNSYWLVKGAHGAARRVSGEAVRCGDAVRLQHLATGRNLHSHMHRAPMSNDYEVSAYRDEAAAAAAAAGRRWFEGDTGDSWVVVCEDGKGAWDRFKRVSMKHVDTGRWLSSSKKHEFGHPTANQLQVCASSRKGRDTYWKTNEGLFMHPAPERERKSAGL